MRILWWTLPLLAVVVAAEASAQCSCGPDFCVGDARVPKRLATKKADLKQQGYPADMIALLDKSDACYAAIDRAPDGFSLMTVKANGDTLITQWDTDNENAAKQGSIAGDLKAYYKFNARKAFACCERPKAEDRPDWDAALGLSKGQAIACHPQGSTVSCQ